ncbi:MAG: quinohemoprotein amine dehydrogenase subunit beta [Haliea sp.]|nr:quinohemoprotein amine dehydrogenase subunit beta [Haliea sp.]
MSTRVIIGGLLSCLFVLSGCSRQEEAVDAGPSAAAAPPVEESSGPATRDYMATVSRPNVVNLIDLHDNKVVRRCELPSGAAPGTLVVSPDRNIAYALSDSFGNVFGVSLETCEVVFSTQQSEGNVRVKTIGSLAVSPDGSEIYTHQNRVTLNSDHYQVETPRVAVFDTAGGLDSRPVRTFEAPRQVTIMATDAKGALYLGGADIYRMDVNTGEYEIALASRSLDDPRYTQRDILSVWPIGEVNREFVRMYSVARYQEGSDDLDSADWLWGYERVDLETGATEDRDFGPLEVVLFTSLRRPGHPDRVYGVLTELKEFDAATQSVLRTVELDHTYYCVNFSTDGSRLYLSGALSDVAVYDADSLEKITNIQLSGDMGMANSYVFSRGTI